MRLAARTVVPPSLDPVKMEERKRPSASEDSAPPAKRQAVAVNGLRPHPDADMPWKDDIEAFQKDAILRQMREYKREKATIESQLSEIENRSQYHDDHLRTIDIWFDQLIDEIKILSGEKLTAAQQDDHSNIPKSLFFEDSESLRKHLAGRKDKILSALTTLFAKFPPVSPEVAGLQQQMSKLLAAEKEHICTLQRVNAEKEKMNDLMVAATHRYMLAEKKLDRFRSAQVQKLESQSVTMTSIKEETTSVSNGEPMNGVESSSSAEGSESDRKQALAEAAKRKEHVEQLEAENKKLTQEVSALNIRLAGLSDDDYAKTELFKAFKSQHEDVIKRINNLEATNIQLRTEAQKYQAERTAYRIKIDEEARDSIRDSEGAVVQAEANLTRIRHARDELLSKVSILEASQKNANISKQQTQELMSACESRISALESECERLRLQISEKEQVAASTEQGDLTPEQLQSKLKTLQSQYELVANELPAMEAAWKKAQAVAGRKISEIATWEENVTKAYADKAKADQKYFGAMKAKELVEQQLRVLRAQSTKGTEVIAQLKEADSASRALVDKLEKQTAEMRVQMEELQRQHRELQQKTNESAIITEGYVSQIAELKKHVESKDAAYLEAKKAKREAEVDRDKMAEKIEGLDQQIDHWKQKSLGNQSEHTALMESMLQCQICKNKIKDTVIKTCGHVFCDGCVQDRLINRARKCPNCGKAFGNGDLMHIHL
ncbi:E3 ubiquitin-protein ligase-like protein bre1 [Bimuria novae-zelandiae CBS 107.79]|uniref:E3 ubiquitin protein ligase n=1 Tax=Bimuria novae-zelandiae CBS 107.79 TaxID=1447943 RepID=A0A6A5V5R9_9PLEO|nr:E3 ubiquitin-protein ligase-like protein bre1 [Bimuria novae-zelandiae CBS 107.79]